jgi:predicted  nucleic acid-binding Zn-ribbon protein
MHGSNLQRSHSRVAAGLHAKLKSLMHPDTHLVIHVQSIDQRIGALEKEVAALPKHIAAIEKTLESHNRKLEADRAALSANQKERKKLEGDIQVHEQKISKLRDQMLGAKTNEQYKAFQHEIEFIEKEIRKAEDRILELMGESEPLDLNVKKAEIALKEEKLVVEGEKKQARERTAADQSQIDGLRKERAEATSKLNPAVIKEYERIRKKWNGIAIAEVVGGRCEACQILLRPQHLQDLKRAEGLLTCENCGRFLYLNPPVLVEDGTRVAMS